MKVDFINFLDIVVGAYRGRIGSLRPIKEQLKAFFMHNQNNGASIRYYGLWEDNKLVGGMQLQDFEMNLNFLHKQEKIA
ncbi:hypothetical protein AMS59_06145 [Lysinibacillus sp. FJAT-14745]|uniref:hypothetical protein n=1 Tax=Lysinibacillus sp. FJAT-14745 TaxID=1704289 RepID=UPI0006ABDF85|nr:hypothetical protein [Lysinibacillus sp. FJAT-14745]KOP79783.1 hypothetical protein AMS59_06145 [Lysinibacillus sp. FJAT-14745]